MNRKTQFEQDKRTYKGELTHIAKPSNDPFVNELDELYGAADALSLKNANQHRRILLALSAVGTLLTMLFLLYDEAKVPRIPCACRSSQNPVLFVSCGNEGARHGAFAVVCQI